jgi:D-sedoheptulose 7-phosphate isomerase
MKNWIGSYLEAQKLAWDSVPAASIEGLIEIFARALASNRQIFVAGNGGSAANASHLATDLGKGASDRIGRRFRVLSLNDNVSWLTAIGNDYAYEDVFVRQLQNFARSGDLLLVMSVSGNSPNLVKAVDWANRNGLTTIALVGKKRGCLSGLVRHVIAVDSDHYGRVEDAHMGICHMLCYAFMERPEITGAFSKRRKLRRAKP